jgi:hypothetical protein
MEARLRRRELLVGAGVGAAALGPFEDPVAGS